MTLPGQHDLNTGWMAVQNYRATPLCPWCVVHHFIVICGSKLELPSWNSGMGAKLSLCGPCDIEIGWTLKHNRAYLLCLLQPCASFIAIFELKPELLFGNAQIQAKLVLTSMTLNTDLWSWPFAWIMVITPDILMRIQGQEHCQRGVTNRQIDRWIHRHRCSWSC